MAASPVSEGYLDFDWPPAGKPMQTYYRIVGDLKTSKKRPLVVLHGGPGLTLDYVYPIEDLWSLYGIPVIFYQQFGAGKSTLIPERNGDYDFFSDNIWFAELENVLKQLGVGGDYDLLGQSWGGMIGATYVAEKQPKGLNKLVIANSPATMQGWAKSCNMLMERLPQDVQDTIRKHEKAGTYDDEEYETASLEFYKQFACRVFPFPEQVGTSLDEPKKNPTVYMTMQGPSEFTVIGKMKDWSIVDIAHKINVSTLLINSAFDMAQDFVVKPFFDKIPKIKWVRFENSSHMPHFEERERFMEIVGEFLED